MIEPKDYKDEEQRLKALYELNLLDSGPERDFDNLTALATKLCGTPIALVTLLDRDRQFFKSNFGVEVRETPRKLSFCGHAIHTPLDIFIVKDARKDKRFKDNPLVAGKPNIVFYAGVPLLTREEMPLGTLCVIDKKPRKLTAEQIDGLKELAHQAMRLLELRRLSIELKESHENAQQRSARLQNIITATHLGTWEWNIKTGETIINDRWAEILGYTVDELMPTTLETWNRFAHPDDIKLSDERLKDCFEGRSEYYEIECRMRHKDGHWVWVQDRGKVIRWDEDGSPLWMFGTHLDITERKLAESQLLSISDNIPGAVFRYELKPDGTDSLLKVSRGAFQLWGIDAQAAMANNQLVWERYDPRDIKAHRESIAQSAKKMSAWKHEWRYNHPDGSLRWHRGRGTPHKNQDGTIVWDSIVLDITAEKEAEISLVEKETRFRTLVENSGDAVAILSADGLTTYVTPSIKNVLGYSESEAMQLNLAELMHPEDQGEVFDVLANALKMPGVALPPHVARAKHKNGHWIYVEATITNMLHEPHINGIVDNFRDVTERVLSEQAIRASNERFELVSRATNEAIYDWDIATDKLEWGEGFERIFGHKSGKKTTWSKYVHPSDLEKIKPKLQERLSDKNANNWTSEYRFKRATGGYAIVQENGFIIRDKEGQALKMVGSLQDVTDQRELAELVDRSSELARIGSWDVDLKTGEIYWSEMTRKIHVVPEDFVPTQENTSLFFKEAGTYDVISDFFDRAINQGESFDAEVPIKVGNGHIRWVRIIGEPEFENNVCIRIYGSFQDVHVRKTAEIALNERSRLLTALTESMRVLLENENWQEALQQCIAQFGHAMRADRVFFFTCTENGKTTAHHLFSWLKDSDKLEKNNADFQNLNLREIAPMSDFLLRGEPFVEVTSNLPKGKLKRDLQSRQILSTLASPIMVGNRLFGFLGCDDCEHERHWNTDQISFLQTFTQNLSAIIARTEAMAAMAQANERFNLIGRASNDAIWDWDIEQNTRYWGNGFAHLFGHDLENVKPAQDIWKAQIHPDDLDRVMRSFNISLADPNTIFWEDEYRYRHLVTGKYHRVIDNGIILRNPAGIAIRMLGTIRDLTENYELHELLERASELARIGSWEIEMPDMKLYWSPMVHRIFEVEPHDTPTFERAMGMIEAGPHRKSMQNAISLSIATGEPIDLEVRIHTEKGQTCWLRIIGAAEFNNESCTRVYGSIQDIDMRKTAELQRDQMVSDLKERIKEQECLYHIAHLSNFTFDVPALLAQAAKLIPTGWKYDSDAVALVSFDNTDYWSGQAIKSSLQLSASRATLNGKKLQVSVFYPEHIHIADQPIFLVEEEKLIETIADNLVLNINQIIASQNNKVLLDSTEEGIYGVDEHGKCTFINQAALKMLGYEMDECIGQNIHKLIHHSQADGKAMHEKDCSIHKAIVSGTALRAENELFWTKDGHSFPVRYSSTPIKSNKLNRGAVVVFNDITEQKRNEALIQESEQRFKALVQDGSDLIGILQPDGIYKYVSPTSTSILGISPDEFIGKNAFDFLHEEDKARVEEAFQALETKNQVKVPPFRFKNNKGEWRWIETIITDMRDIPSINGYVSNSRDITDSIQIQNELIKSNERFELVMQAGTESIWEFDPNTGDLFLGDGFARNFGIKPKSRSVNNKMINALVHPDDLAVYTLSFKSALNNTADHSWTHEYRLKSHHGKFAYVKDRAIIQRDENGMAYKVVGAIKNITIEKFYDQLDQLERQVLEMNARQDVSLRDIATHYCLGLEKLHEGMLCSVQLIKNGRIQNLAAPGLPDTFIKAIENEKIGNNRGSCGTAAFLKQNVFVSDTQKDKRWIEFKDLASAHNLRAAWSIPILDSAGACVATFAFYFGVPKLPEHYETDTLERSAQILRVIIRNHEQRQAIFESNERFEIANKASNDAIYDWDIEQDIFLWGDQFETLFGHQFKKGTFTLADWAALSHPIDRESHQAEWDAFLKDPLQSHWTNSFRLRRADGTYAYVDEVGYLMRDQVGAPKRMIGALRDQSDKKLVELQRELQHKLSLAFKNELPLQSSIQLAVKQLVDFGGFIFGEIWAQSIDKKQLRAICQYAANKKAQSFFNETANLNALKIEEGIQGKAYKEGTLQLWDKKLMRQNLVRFEAAKKAGISATIGIPLVHNENIVGAMVFGSTHALTEKDDSVTILNATKRFLGAEIMRKQQEEELTLLFESAPDIMAVASPNGNFAKVNPAFCALLGYTADEITSKNILDFLHPEDRERTAEEYAENVEGTHRARNFINRYLTKSGEYKWISWASSAPFNEEGYIFAYGRDVSKIVHLQHLLDNASRLAKLGGWEVDLINETVYFSDITREIHEVENDFVPDLETGINFYREDVRHIIKQAIEDSIAKCEPWDLELPIITAKGRERWIRTIGKPQYTKGKCVAITGSFQDIHDRKAIEMRLKRISDSVPGILFEYHLMPDGTDKFEYVSKGSKEIWGLSPEVCKSNPNRVWEGVEKGGNLNAVKESIARSMKDMSKWHAKSRYVMPNGTVRYHEGHGTPHKLANGTIVWHSIVLDITEKHELEELAHRTSKMARIGSWELDLTKQKGEAWYWSPMTREILEVPESYNPSLSDGFDIYESDSKQQIQHAVNNLIEHGEPFDLELKITTANGNKRWIRCMGQGEYVGKKCLRIFGSFQDIHKQKQAELDIEAAYDERNTILESIGDAFFAVDRNFKVLYWNHMAEQLLHTPRATVLGKNLWDVFKDATHLPSYKEYHRAMEEMLNVQFEDYYEPIDTWFEISAYPGNKGLTVYFKDITERKKAIELIRQTNERFEKISEATNDAIWDYDVVGNNLFWGKGFMSQFGYDPTKTKPSIDLLIGLIHPDDRERVSQKIEQYMTDGLSTNWFEEYRFKKADGKYAYIIDRAIFIRNQGKTVTRVVGAMTDITYRREFEEQLQRLNADLEQRAKELAISNKELEQFAYVASHDLQEPLRMVSSFMSQLDKKYADKLDEKARLYIHFATDGARRMRQIILDLLEFSRIGQSERKRDRINLQEVLEEVLLLHQNALERENAKVIVGKMPEIITHKSHLRQIFQNLIGNAIKYRKPDISPMVEVHCKTGKTEYTFSVSDNGIGIDSEYFDRIFIIFQRLHNKDEYSGTGMGLAITKKMVEHLGGKIWVESEDGKGSTFYFTIPKQ